MRDQSFAGFPDETFQFLRGIADHNEKTWFEENRALYEAGYVAAGTAFVAALGPGLAEISPKVRFAPKVNGSVARINRDIRFSKDKRPYKDHLDLWFWHGERRGWDTPGFWFRLSPDHVMLGTGMHMLDKAGLATMWQAVARQDSAAELLDAIAQIKAAGPYDIGGKSRKLPARGYSATGPAAEYLLYEGLHAGIDLPADAARTPDFLAVALKHYRATWPVSRWLLAHVTGEESAQTGERP